MPDSPHVGIVHAASGDSAATEAQSHPDSALFHLGLYLSRKRKLSATCQAFACVKW